MRIGKSVSLAGGSIAGFVLAVSLSALFQGQVRALPKARLVSDVDGALSEVCVHYNRTSHDACIETLEDFFSAMSEDVDIRVIVEKQEEFDFLKKELDGVKHGPLHAVVTGYPITPWAKDRFGTLVTEDGGSVLALPTADSPMGGARGNDGRVPGLLAKRFEHIETRRMSFFFEGGDLLCTENLAFVAANCLARNQPLDVDNRDALLGRMSGGMSRELIVIGESQDQVPDHHIGMYLTPLSDRVVAVADPDLGLELYAGTDVSVETDKSKYEPFRNVIRIMEEKGFTVIRVPMLLTSTPRVYVTYNNAILETRNGEKRIYMPVYGIPELDKAATALFEGQGWKVLPVRVDKVYRHTGSLRCLVGIIGRERAEG